MIDYFRRRKMIETELKNRRLNLGWQALTVLAIVVFMQVGAAGDTFVVSNLGDGSGSLLEAIIKANSNR